MTFVSYVFRGAASQYLLLSARPPDRPPACLFQLAIYKDDIHCASSMTLCRTGLGNLVFSKFDWAQFSLLLGTIKPVRHKVVEEAQSMSSVHTRISGGGQAAPYSSCSLRSHQNVPGVIQRHTSSQAKICSGGCANYVPGVVPMSQARLLI